MSALSQYFKYYCTDILLCDLHVGLVGSDVALCFYVALSTSIIPGRSRREPSQAALPGAPASAR